MSSLLKLLEQQIPDSRFQTKLGNTRLYPFSDLKAGKALPFGETQFYMTYLRVYPPPPRDLTGAYRDCIVEPLLQNTVL